MKMLTEPIQSLGKRIVKLILKLGYSETDHKLGSTFFFSYMFLFPCSFINYSGRLVFNKTRIIVIMKRRKGASQAPRPTEQILT